MKTPIKIVDVVGKTELILPSDGLKVYKYVAERLSPFNVQEISFEGAETVTTAFCRQLFGNLFLNHTAEYLARTIQITDIEHNEIWTYKINNAIKLGLLPDLLKHENGAVESLLEQ